MKRPQRKYGLFCDEAYGRASTNPDSLRGTVTEFDVHPPSVGREVNQSRSSERDPRIRNERFLKSPHAMQNVHIEGLKILNAAVGGHRAPSRLFVADEV